MVYPKDFATTDFICTALHHEYHIKQVTYVLDDNIWFQLLGLGSCLGNLFIAAVI